MNEHVIEETQEICSMCGGRGQELSGYSTAMYMTCRWCHGARYIVTKRTIRRVVNDPLSSGMDGGALKVRDAHEVSTPAKQKDHNR